MRAYFDREQPMLTWAWFVSRAKIYLVMLAIWVLLIGLLLVTDAIWRAAFARTTQLAQWEDIDPALRGWFQRQTMPDYPGASCCGEADAYYADSWEVKDGKVYAIVTDMRDDARLGRPHIDPGTRILVPDNKFKDSRSDPNPDGHGVLFVSSTGNVFCYIAPGGV